MIDKIILASRSGVRKKILNQHEINCEVVPANVDEESIKESLLEEKETPKTISKNLAELKANKVSKKNSNKYVLGADSVIDLNGEIISKPKSREEADMVKRIVYQFKYHMASDFIEGSGMREMEIPSTFDIQYQYLGDENKNLNRISTCFLESVEVAYGGDRFQAYDDGVPQQTKLNLKFREMEIITKKMMNLNI